ncbi:hypothetical protein BDL97_07G046600 [Sphagnum fallax]|nr:hypothetical protein BDL97_07G046600 [Sphagnum fallax]
MNPPPDATYDNVDALKAVCRQHVAAHLYSVTTKRSDYKIGFLLLHCGKSGTCNDRHGLTEETRKCPSSSVLTGCPFLLQGRRNRVGSWMLRVKCGEHNHPPLTREAAHPSHCKMTNDAKERVCILSTAGVAPTQILTLIRSEPSGEHALLSSLIKLDVPNTHCVYANRRLTRLAFTSTKAVQLTRRFGTVLTMDCTYKTNRFKMPLLHIVSFACTRATFTSAIAFLSPHAVQYVLSWIQYKTYFVGACVDKVPHFELSSSSRVEGAHSTLKQRLQVSTGDMMTVVERVLQFLADYLMLWTRLGVREVVRQVSSVALIKIHLQFTIAKEHAGRKVRPQPNPRFETVMGLPSATTIYDLRVANQSLPMSAVHKQWWLALDLQLLANIINASGTKRL